MTDDSLQQIIYRQDKQIKKLERTVREHELHLRKLSAQIQKLVVQLNRRK